MISALERLQLSRADEQAAVALPLPRFCAWTEERCDVRLGANNRSGLCSGHGDRLRQREFRQSNRSTDT